MPSKLSEILMGYRDSLEASQEDYENEYQKRVEHLEKHYENWFSVLIRTYKHDNTYIVDGLKNMIEQLSGSDELPFAACCLAL